MSKKSRGMRDQLSLDIPLSGLAGPRSRNASVHSERVFNVVSAQSLMTLQRLVTTLEIERGTYHESVKQKALLLGEEVHEVLKALRIRSGIATSGTSNADALGEELTDVLFVSCAIANRAGIDLGTSLMSAHLDSFTEPEDLLSAALDISKWSLSVMRDCQVFHERAGEDVSNRSLPSSLAGLVRSVAWAAVFDDLLLGEAIDRKLSKDHSRRWQ